MIGRIIKKNWFLVYPSGSPARTMQRSYANTQSEVETP